MAPPGRAGAAARAALAVALGATAACRSAPMPVSQIYDPITTPRGTWTVGLGQVYRADVSDYREPSGTGEGRLVAGDSPLRYAATDRLELGLGVVRYAVARGDDDGAAARGPLQLAVGLAGAVGYASAPGAVDVSSPEGESALRSGLILSPGVEALATLRVGRVRLEGGALAVPVTVNTTLDWLVTAYAGATAQLVPAVAVGVRARARYVRDETALPASPRRAVTADRLTAEAGLEVTLRWRLARKYDVFASTEVTGGGQRHVLVDEPMPDDFVLRLSGAVWQVGAVAGVTAYW